MEGLFQLSSMNYDTTDRTEAPLLHIRPASDVGPHMKVNQIGIERSDSDLILPRFWAPFACSVSVALEYTRPHVVSLHSTTRAQSR